MDSLRDKRSLKDWLLKVENVSRSFKINDKILEVLKDVNLTINKGDFLGIYGPSGSGKSTLLYIMSLIDKADKGKVIFNKKYVKLDYEKDPYEFRLRHLGFVFQQYKLIPELTALENIILPNIFIAPKDKLIKRALELMKFLGILELKDQFPNKLSGGQQQRVAIARALLKKPLILFADEPTANLDVENGIKIMELFKKINRELGTTVVCVSHEEDHKKFFNRLVNMEEINKLLKK